LGHWQFEFGIYLLFGAWCLKFFKVKTQLNSVVRSPYRMLLYAPYLV
jgi:hypothetical protein